MTVVFGFPSAEHVTITAGVPFSSTGRISGGRRVMPISALDGRDEAGSRAGSGRLQVDLEHLELDGQRRVRDKCAQNAFGDLGVHRPKAPHKTPTNAIHDLHIVVPHWTVAEVAALELIGLVRRELLDGDGQFPVLPQRLDKSWRELLGNERRHRALVGADTPPTHFVPVRHEIAITRARERDVGMLLQEAKDLARDHNVSGYAISSAAVKRRPRAAAGSYLQRLSDVLRSRHLRWQPAHAVLSVSEFSIILS